MKIFNVFITGLVLMEVVYWAYSGKTKPICIDQGVKFLFFPIFSYFSQHTPIFPIFQQFPPIFPIF